MGYLTLHEKEKLLMESVAITTEQDWNISNKLKDKKSEIVNQLNNALLRVLDYAKSIEDPNYQQIAERFFNMMDKIAKKHPGSGLYCNKNHVTIARFFAVNYKPTMYYYIISYETY